MHGGAEQLMECSCLAWQFRGGRARREKRQLWSALLKLEFLRTVQACGLGREGVHQICGASMEGTVEGVAWARGLAGQSLMEWSLCNTRGVLLHNRSHDLEFGTDVHR